MGKPGGGRNDVDPRFISMFSVYNVTFPSSETLSYIYTSILSGHLQTFSEGVRNIAGGLVRLTLEIYEVISQLVRTHVQYGFIKFFFVNSRYNALQYRISSVSDSQEGIAADAVQVSLHLQHARSLEDHGRITSEPSRLLSGRKAVRQALEKRGH